MTDQSRQVSTLPDDLRDMGKAIENLAERTRIVEVLEKGEGTTGVAERLLIRKVLFDVTLSVAGHFDIQNIPQDYEHLEIYFIGKSDDTGFLFDAVQVFYNNDLTPTNYNTAWSYGGTISGAPATAGAFVANDGRAHDVNTTAPGYHPDEWTISQGIIQRYAETGKRKWFTGSLNLNPSGVLTDLVTEQFSQGWKNTAAINRISTGLINGVNLLPGSRLVVSGVRSQPVVISGTRGQAQCIWHPEPSLAETLYNFYCNPEDPLDDFTLFDPDTTLAGGADGCDGLTFELDDSAANGLVGYGKTPASIDPGRVVIRCGMMGVPLTDRNDCGLAIWQDISSSSSDLYTIGFRTNGTQVNIEVNYWNDYQNLNTLLASINAGAMTGGFFAARTDSGGDLYLSYSADGLHWFDLWSGTPAFTLGEFGWFGNNNGGGRDPSLHLWNWYVEDDIGLVWANANLGFNSELLTSDCEV